MKILRRGLGVATRNLFTSTNTMAPTVVLDNMNPCIKKMEYAVRGPLVIRATAIEQVIKDEYVWIVLLLRMWFAK